MNNDAQIKGKIEEIQRNTILALGRDPVIVKKQIRELEQSFSGTVASSIANDQSVDEVMDNLKIAMPEMLYGQDKDEIVQRFFNISGTSFDRNPFLERFVNIEALCHTYFTKDVGAKKLKIRLSSLPLSQVNGVAFYTDNRERVVLLNEGLLYAVPDMLAHSIEFSELTQLHISSQESEENAKQAFSIISELHQDHIGPFFTTLIRLVSGDILPFEMMKGDDPYLPHANEKWAFMQNLRQEVSAENNWNNFSQEELLQIDKPQKHKFLAGRGFFTLVTAHEFSHFYRQHHELRSQESPIRPFEECSVIFQEIRAFTRNPTKTFSELMNNHYLISQPTETEADADGLKCVLKYCRDNNLEGEEFKQVILGALSAFLYMELCERIANLVRFSPEKFENYRIMPEHIRNAYISSEHPCPLSRPILALQHDVWEDENDDVKNAIFELWNDMHYSLDWIWCEIGENLRRQLIKHNFNPQTQMSRQEHFLGLSAVGCFDSE